MKTEKELRTDSSQYNKSTEHNQQVHEKQNTYVNRNKIIELLESGRAKDISQEPRKNGEPCFIISSGPSLDLSLPKLKDWKYGVICQPSQALTLIHYGVKIDFIAVLDPFCEWKEFEGFDWSTTNTKLIINPGCWPDLFEKWPNEFLLYRQSLSNPTTFYATGQRDAFMKRTPTQKALDDPNYELGRAFREAQFEYLLTTEITSFACSPPFQIFCADFLKYGNLFLTGFDFGYTYGKERFTNMIIKSEAKTVDFGGQKIDVATQWDKVERPYVENDQMVMSDNGIPSEALHLYYKKNLFSAWRLCKKTLYIVDVMTVCTEIPFIPIEEVISHEGQYPIQSETDIIDITENYLAGVGAYVVDCVAGISFIESVNPMGNGKDKGDIENFITHNINSRYICPTCHYDVKIMPRENRLNQAIQMLSEIMSETSEDKKAKELVTNTYRKFLAMPSLKNYNGLKCPQCKQGSLIQASPADLNSNLDRINKRIKDNG